MEKRKNNKEAVEEALQRKDIEGLHDDIQKILDQTTKTNGRVNKLEAWQSFLQGGLAILSLLVVPIFLYVITHYR